MVFAGDVILRKWNRCLMSPIFNQSHQDNEERDGYVHPTRLINFLVGVRGKTKETMAIGGPWSPSLDGPNPDKDPSVLIKTAIRTCKALTGVDLSSCTQWYVKNAPLLHFSFQPKIEEKSGTPNCFARYPLYWICQRSFPWGSIYLDSKLFPAKNFQFNFTQKNLISLFDFSWYPNISLDFT